MLLIQQCFLILVWLTLLKLNLSKFLHTYYLCIKLSPINCELSIANSYTSWFKDFSTSLTWALEKSLSLLPIQTHCVKLFRKEQSYFSSSSYLITIFSNFSWISCKNAGTYQKKDFSYQRISCFNPLCMNMKRCSVLFCDASLSMPLIPSLSKKRRIGRSNPTPFDKNTVQHYLRGESPYLCSRSCTSYTIFDFGLIDVFPPIVSSLE